MVYYSSLFVNLIMGKVLQANFNTINLELSNKKYNCWCQELVGTFLTSKKLFDFNLRKEKQILMKFNIK